MSTVKRIAPARKHLGLSQEQTTILSRAHQSAVVHWKLGQVEPHNLFVHNIEAITNADIVRSPEAA
ncbi:MAG: hypothetical protein OXQ84_21690 [bacterium]|nr:hypothetical protein [bacterium]